jgi:hypothetical protein
LSFSIRKDCDVKLTLIQCNIIVFIIVFACSNVEPRCECQDIHINCTNLRLECVPPDIEEEITWLWVYHHVNCNIPAAYTYCLVWFELYICVCILAPLCVSVCVGWTVCVCACVRMYMHVRMCACACMCTHVCMCAHMQAYTVISEPSIL